MTSIPFSVDWILKKQDHQKNQKVDHIKDTIRAYEQANRFTHTHYFEDIPMLKYYNYDSGSNFNASQPRPYCARTKASATTKIAEKPCFDHSQDDVFIDDRITMTTISSKSKGTIF